jgi:hypothetical protein
MPEEMKKEKRPFKKELPSAKIDLDRKVKELALVDIAQREGITDTYFLETYRKLLVNPEKFVESLGKNDLGEDPFEWSDGKKRYYPGLRKGKDGKWKWDSPREEGENEVEDHFEIELDQIRTDRKQRFNPKNLLREPAGERHDEASHMILSGPRTQLTPEDLNEIHKRYLKKLIERLNDIAPRPESEHKKVLEKLLGEAYLEHLKEKKKKESEKK